MDLNCPKCKSEQTQKITSIVDSGTTHTHGRSTSVGVASTGRGIGVGTASTTSTSTSKTVLATKLGKPQVKKVYPIVMSIVFLVFIAWLPATIITAIFGGNTFGLIMVLGGVGGLTYLVFNYFKKQEIKANEYNTNMYPKAIHEWENGFYCHRCETVFVPA